MVTVTLKGKGLPYTHELKSLGVVGRRRARECFARVELKGRVLDIGEENELKCLMEEWGDVEIDSTFRCDFNKTLRSNGGSYDTVLCFEVMEHLMNPAHFMTLLWAILKKDGVLYLTTPRKSLFRQLDQHFTEYGKGDLEKVV